MLTPEDKAWIKQTVADAIAAAQKTERAPLADVIWKYSQTSPLTQKSVTMRSQLLNARAEISEVKATVADIEKNLHTPGE